MLVLLTDTAHDRFADQLRRPGVEWVTMGHDGSLADGAGRPVEWGDADVEVAWGTSDLFGEGAPLRAFFGLLTRLPDLRWFQSPAAGYDAPVFATLAGRGVRVCNAHVNSLPIAEFVMRSVLEEFQQAGRWREGRRERAWSSHDWREVAGSTWVVVGLGGIGSHVAVRAGAFGARVIGCRRNPNPADPVERTVPPDRLVDVVGDADVLVLAAPATPQTSGMVDATLLSRLKEGSILVNVARGELVDEEALLASLDRGRPAVAVLDVFRTEPLPPDHPFWDHPGVRITPHNAAGGVGRLQRQADLFGENLGHYLAGEPLRDEITGSIAGATATG